MQRLATLLLFLAASNCPAQSPQQSHPRFEVASVKSSGSERDASNDYIRGGPGTEIPQRIAWRVSLLRLLTTAYELDFDQVSGLGWIGSERYTVEATFPATTTKAQFALMLRDLLAERFHLKTHIVPKEFPAWELIVAKSGPKIHPAGKGPDKPAPGFPELSPGKKFGYSMAMPRNVRLSFRECSMPELAQRLGWPLGSFGSIGGVAGGRVSDGTGLSGLYDFNLEYSGVWGPVGYWGSNTGVLRPLPDGEIDTAPPLFEALRRQLGLELKEKKTVLDVLVVDQVDKIPTEN